MSHKIAKLAFWLIPILCLSLCPVALIAQTAAPEKKAEKSQTVTGCLQKGDEAGEFSLKGEDGKTWGLRSTSVKLDQHIGHQVTVTGSTTRETKAEEKREGQVENAGSKTEYADLTVTNLKMISDSCSK
jgi:Protein of unknown function (DUF5818)